MSNKQTNIISFSILAIVIIWLINKNNKKNKENKALKNALNSSNLISDHLRERLLALLSQHPNIDEDIKGELQSIAVLLGLQQETVAILKLAKVIENLLKRLYKNDTGFKEWAKSKGKKRQAFADYLDYGNEQKVIPKEDYHLISVLKLIRNEEAHEMNITKDKAKMVGCFMAGISVTLGLYQKVRSKTVSIGENFKDAA